MAKQTADNPGTVQTWRAGGPKAEKSSSLKNSRDSNPGLLGKKRKRYLCAMQPPHKALR